MHHMIKISPLERDIFPDKAQQIRGLQLVLAGILLTLSLFFLVANLFPSLHSFANNNVLTLSLIASCLIGEWLLYRRQLKPAYYLLVVSFYIVLTINLYLSATVWFLSIIGYFGLITLSFLFSERSQGVFLTAVIVLTIFIFHFFIPTTAYLPPPAVTFSVACAIPLHAIIIFWLTQVLSQGFQQAQKQSEALTMVNQELAHHKHLLEKHVQERTAELAATNDKLQLTVEEYRSLVKELRLLESAVEHTSDAIVLINTRFDTGQAKHYLQYINPAFTRLLGYAPADVLGQSPEVLFGPEKTAVLLSLLTSTSLPPEGLTEELVIARQNDTELWVEVNFTAVWQNHQLDYWVAVLRDISQRKQVEQQLRLMESVATKTHNGVAILDTSLPQPQMAYVNDGFCRLTGHTADTAVGKTLDWLYGPATNPDTSRQIQDATNNHSPLTAELVLYRQDNTPIWCALNLTPVFNHDNELTHWVTILTDISHRKELDEQLLMLNAVVANATEGVVITKIQADTPDQNIVTYVNQAFT
ncbi:MAG: PAS domain-containing protein, partial [Anaerolineales bacterium]|nr:PAS domain-containing protein [Anaerolineales bacterium]